MEPNPTISVVTVVLNGEATVRQTIESIIPQVNRHVEYLIIDGGSIDGTVNIILEYSNYLHHWVTEHDHGIYDAMNKAMRTARGDWIIFIGADDQLLAELTTLKDHLKKPDAIYYGDVHLRASGKLYGGKFNRYKLMQKNICHQAIFYPRSIYKTRPYDTMVGLLADHKMNIELWGNRVPFIYLREIICRFNDQGQSSQGQADFEAAKLAAIKANFGPFYYVAKILRTIVVRLIKGRNGSL